MHEEKSFWSETAANEHYPSLQTNEEADVVVVGAGITGLTAAWLQTQLGKKVIVLEARNLGYSATAQSSAHLTTESDYQYSELISKYNLDTAKTVAQSRKEAISFIEKISEKFDADFKRVSGYLYSETPDKDLDKEFRAAMDAGLEVEKASGLPLPFSVHQAVEFKNQAIFNPYKYLKGMAEYINSTSLCRIYENSRVTKRDNNTVFTEFGSIKARNIVYATHYPVFFDLHQSMVYAWRSYMIAAKTETDIGDSIYWDMADPYHYTRTYGSDGDRWLLVGGADHKTGHTDTESFIKIENYLKQRYRVTEIGHKWSNQFYESADSLPFIGKSYSGSEYIATGFSGDGLVWGTVAGILLSSQIAGNPKMEWNKIFDAKRLNIAVSSGTFIKENLSVAKHLITGRFPKHVGDDVRKLAPGEGMVVSMDTQSVAVSRSDSGDLIAVSAVCPHLKCIVKWNSLEKTWDCPCHGSRFSADGDVITGPAVTNLKAYDPES